MFYYQIAISQESTRHFVGIFRVSMIEPKKYAFHEVYNNPYIDLRETVT